MKIEKPIVGQDIYLKTLDNTDATTDYISWLSDPDINQYLETRFSNPPSLSQLQDFISAAAVGCHTLLLGIFLVCDDRHIGNIKLGPIDWNHYSGDIGLLIGDRGQWGKGYASAAIKLLSQYAFEELKLAKLTAGCYALNKGSMNAFLKAGFVQEGIKKSQWKLNEERQDGILLGLVNQDLKN